MALFPLAPSVYNPYMKQILLLGGLLLALTACGSTTPDDQASELGTLSLTLYKLGPSNLSTQDIFSEKTTNVRVRVSNQSTGFNVVRDVAVNATGSVNIQVPATSGYLVEAISYRSGTTLAYYKEGAKSNITAVANATTRVDLQLVRPNFKVVIPSSVVSGQPFKLTVSGVPAGFRLCQIAATNMPRTLNQYNINSPSISGGNGEITINAPEANSNGKMYVYVVCFRDLSSSSPWNIPNTISFVDAFLPDIDVGEAQLTANLTASPTIIDIGIGY